VDDGPVDDETTTMQVRAPFLERVDNGEQLPFMHRILFSALESFVEKGTPRGDALFTPWSGGRDCRAAYR
jgi:hypothetical protein